MTDQDARTLVAYVSIKCGGDWGLMNKTFHDLEGIDLLEAKEAVSKLKCSYVTMLDEEYPQALKKTLRPPYCLFYYGDLSLARDEEKIISYIGSRDASPYGLEMARNIAGDLAKKGYIILTGMARGIDAEANRGALEAGGKSIAVLGSGIDNPYPSSSMDVYERLKVEGLVLSEYPPKAPPIPSNFPMRNRLVGTLCQGLVVGEASRRSGTLITVAFALNAGKDVGAVPHHANIESACNALIKDGAPLIEDAEDVVAMISPFHEPEL